MNCESTRTEYHFFNNIGSITFTLGATVAAAAIIIVAPQTIFTTE